MQQVLWRLGHRMLEAGENRAEILQACGKSECSDLWLEEDATEREELIQDCLRKEG